MAFEDLVRRLDAAQLAAFGIQTTYQPAVGSPVPVSGVFDDAYVLVGAEIGEHGPGVSSTAPAVFYRLVDLPVDPKTDDPTITIKGVAYEVAEVKPDGQGSVWFVLKKK